MADDLSEIGVGDGLVLRRWSEADYDALMAAIEVSYDELHQWMPWAVRPLGDGERAFLQKVEAGEVMGWGLWERESNELVGGFGLHDRVGPQILEIGYWVRSDRTSRGYGTAAARALTTAAFHHFPDVDRVEIHCDAANLASAAIPRKLGYQLLAEKPMPIVTPGQSGRHLYWGVTRREWEGRGRAATS
ncbi:MAG: GNAT family N-acetyltransferase [Acidimicrobiia bacterium]